MKTTFQTIGLTLITSILSINLSFGQNALSFDGSNDYVDCGNDISLQITGTAITLEAWIYPTSWRTNIWQGNIINKETTFQGYMLRCGAGGKLNFNIGSGTSWNELNSSSTILSLNTWQHVAGTYDGTYMRIYLNGVIIDSMARSIPIANSISTVGVGYAPNEVNRHFPGKIDEARIWNVKRTKSQIVGSMNNELCSLPSSLKAYYTFNQGTAGGTNTSVTTLLDLSGNGNNGTLTSFNLSGTTSNWVTGKNLVAGVVVNTIPITTCSSYTMPDGRVITTAGTYYDTLSSSSGCDSLVGYIINFSSAMILNTITTTSCLSYSMPNGRVVSTSGTYYDTLSASTSCDTVDKYIVTISAGVNDSIFLNGNKLTSFDTWAPSHQWVDCDSGYSLISGETNKFYIPTSTGNYAVIVTRGACVDTSDCYYINFTNLKENEFEKSISLFPNPTKDIITIEGFNSNYSLKIISSIGKEVSFKSEISNSTIDLSNFKNGVYFITITDEINGFSTIRKIIKM